MPYKKAAIKQAGLPQLSRGSFCIHTFLAKHIHFEKAAKTASTPQAKKRQNMRLKHMIIQDNKRRKKLLIA